MTPHPRPVTIRLLLAAIACTVAMLTAPAGAHVAIREDVGVTLGAKATPIQVGAGAVGEPQPLPGGGTIVTLDDLKNKRQSILSISVQDDGWTARLEADGATGSTSSKDTLKVHLKMDKREQQVDYRKNQFRQTTGDAVALDAGSELFVEVNGKHRSTGDVTLRMSLVLERAGLELRYPVWLTLSA